MVMEAAVAANSFANRRLEPAFADVDRHWNNLREKQQKWLVLLSSAFYPFPVSKGSGIALLPPITDIHIKLWYGKGIELDFFEYINQPRVGYAVCSAFITGLNKLKYFPQPG